MSLETLQALPRLDLDPLFTLLVLVGACLGGVVTYPLALLLSRRDMEKREALTAWVVMSVGFVMLTYANVCLVLIWPVRYL